MGLVRAVLTDALNSNSELLPFSFAGGGFHHIRQCQAEGVVRCQRLTGNPS